MKAFKLMAVSLLFVFSFVLVQMAFAQAPSPAASPVVAAVVAAPPAASGGIWGWVVSHGGLQASILMLVACFNILVSALRDVLYKVDGVNLAPGAPVDSSKLTLLNKLALVSGQILDWMTANIQHK